MCRALYTLYPEGSLISSCCILLYTPSGSRLPPEQLQLHPQHSSYQPGSSSPPPAERPKPDILQLQEHTMQTCDFQHNHQPPGVQTSAVNTYASYLKYIYTREKLQVYDKWPQVKSKKYINLALIQKKNITRPEAVQFMRATIHGNIDDIKKVKASCGHWSNCPAARWVTAKVHPCGGCTRCGKVHLCLETVPQVGEGKVAPTVPVGCPLEAPRQNCASCKEHLRPLPISWPPDPASSSWGDQRNLGQGGSCFCLRDMTSSQRNYALRDSVFLDVITGRELPEATVLITSRPWASEFLHRECKRHISQHIEILGIHQRQHSVLFRERHTWWPLTAGWLEDSTSHVTPTSIA